MLAYWRVWILIVMVLASVLAIGMKAFPYGREGVEIVYIASGSPAKDVLEQGMIVTHLNNAPVKSVGEWNERVAELAGNITLRANGKDYSLAVNESLGIHVIGIERTNLDFGLDLKGGTMIVLTPQEANVSREVVEQTIAVLETRANLFGLQEIKFLPVQDLGGGSFIQIEAAGVGSDVVDNLLSQQGKFEGKILKPVLLGQQLQLGQQKFPVQAVGNDSVKINNSIVRVNETFVLKGIEFTYLNRSEGNLLFLAKVFEGKDIELVYTDPGRSGVIPQGNFYNFYFTVLISLEGATRFADVTTGIPKFFDANAGEEYLEAPLLLSLDGEIVSSLRISGSLAGQVVQSPQVSGGESTLEEANLERLRLQTILKSGALPVGLKTLSVDVISPTLGAGFFSSALLAALLAAGVVFSIVFIRYRRIRIPLPLILVGLSEIIIILGIAAGGDAAIWMAALAINIILIVAAWSKKHEVDVSAWIGAVLIPLLGLLSWTIDLPAIAGIIAAIGMGVDHLIIITDEALRKEGKLYGMRESIRRAFFIVMGAAMTTIAAMLPLMFLGIGLIRGFAITTIVGVLIGVLVTRPAFAKVVEKAVK